jgi:tetratricopeptide (TPR) repeat protein
MRIVFLLPFLFPFAAFAACPPASERSARHNELMDLVATASNETAAREYTNELWGIWATAPDDTAQEILDRGMTRRASYDFAGAMEDFDTLIAYCPDYAEGYNQRAFVSFIREDYDRALEDLNRAVELTPDHIGAIVGRALALIQLGQTREGQIALRRALLLNPWLPERNRVAPLPEIEENDTKTDL